MQPEPVPEVPPGQATPKQYNLRTLMMIVTGCGLLCGVAYWLAPYWNEISRWMFGGLAFLYLAFMILAVERSAMANRLPHTMNAIAAHGLIVLSTCLFPGLSHRPTAGSIVSMAVMLGMASGLCLSAAIRGNVYARVLSVLPSIIVAAVLYFTINDAINRWPHIKKFWTYEIFREQKLSADDRSSFGNNFVPQVQLSSCCGLTRSCSIAELVQIQSIHSNEKERFYRQ